MSLVNEALKKARAQVAVQEAARGPLVHSVPPPPPAPEKKWNPSMILGMAGGCACAGVVAVLSVYWLGNGATRSDGSSTAKIQLAAVSAEPVHPRVTLTAPPVRAGEDVTAVVALPEAPVESNHSPAVKPEDAVTVPPSTDEATTPAEPPPPTLVSGKVYLQVVDVSDAPKVKVDGILWSEKTPLAMINGVSSAVGDELDEFTVLAIEPRRVKLRMRGKEFFIRLP